MENEAILGAIGLENAFYIDKRTQFDEINSFCLVNASRLKTIKQKTECYLR